MVGDAGHWLSRLAMVAPDYLPRLNLLWQGLSIPKGLPFQGLQLLSQKASKVYTPELYASVVLGKTGLAKWVGETGKT